MTIDFSQVKGLRDVANFMYPLDVKQISLRDLFSKHRFTASEPRTLRGLLRRWDDSRDPTSTTVLFMNTFLMRVHVDILVPIPLPPFGIVEDTVVHEKPASLARAFEIGNRLSQSDFDMAFLCEVWTPDVRTPLLNPIIAAGKLKAIAIGPDGGTSIAMPGGFIPMATGSGLCTIGLRHTFTPDLWHTFSHKGKAHEDMDFHAKKSVMLTRVNVGPGTIDFYSTHLHYGGVEPLFEGPSHADVHAVRLQQLREIVAFIKLTHKPANVAILMGDFNVDAAVASDYEEVCSVLREAMLSDRWPAQFPGGTTRRGQSTMGEGAILDQVCQLGNSNVDKAVPFTGTESSNEIVVCSEAKDQSEAKGHSRIDYVFVEDPRPEQSFTLDVTALRRVAFKRPGITEGIEYMSDHLGLAFSLVCSAHAQGS